MEKRTILAIAMSFLILVAFDFAYKKYFVPEKPPQTAEVSSTGKAPVYESDYEPGALEDSTDLSVTEVPIPTPETDTTTDSLQEIVIESDLYRAVLSNQGAVLYSWILNNYKSVQDNEFEMVAAREKGENWAYPGSLFFEDSDISKLANDEFYDVTVNGQPYSGSRLAPPVEIAMTLKRGDLTIQKTYIFSDDHYTFNLSGVFQKGGRDLEGQFLIGQDIGPKEDHLQGRYTELKATYFVDNKVKRKSAPDQEDGDVTISGNIQWIGLDMHYFTAIAIPAKTISSFVVKGFEIDKEDQQGNSIKRDLLSVKFPFDGSLDCLVYLGPKTQSDLKSVDGYDLSGAIDYGWFSIIALPLLYALLWIQQYVNNFGFSIIILTLLLSILLLPLRLKQMFSMKKMQAIQPKVKAIQEKYKKYKKTDPKRAEMNQEIMALYKASKVNPMGGCLPLLVQFPLLFAFYRLLANSIELRQAHFIWWIKDLSAHDPYYVLPIVMGLTMFLSQKITPMAPTADNQQAKMMQYLPLIFTFMFLKASSGLNLYFLCSNIFQVGFQKFYELFIGEQKNDTKSKRDRKRKK